MRVFILAAALALSACGPAQREAPGACTLEATREIAWPEGDARLTITATSQGADCDSAHVTLNLRGDDAAMTHTISGAYADLSLSETPVARERVQRFLESWADVTQMRSGALPAWDDGMSRPGEGVEALPYASALARADYQAIRMRNLPTICIALRVDAVECLVADREQGALLSVLGYAQ